MFKELQKRLNSRWIKKNNIWDVVIYGSYSRGKEDAKDIDIAVIINKKCSQKVKIAISQELRSRFFNGHYSFDIKTIDFNDFLNPGFLGREAIFAEGYSLIKKGYIAERFGFTAISIVEYSLKNLSLAKQKMLYYALQGRKKGTGILSKLNGKIVSKGVLQVPTKNYEKIKKVLDHYSIKYKTTFSLSYRILY